MGRFRSITHPFAARRQDCSRVTARLACVRHAASVQSEPGSNSSLEDFENHQQRVNPKWLQLTAGHFGHSVLNAKGASTRVPTQITCRTFKEHPRSAKGFGEKGRDSKPKGHARPISKRPQPAIPRCIAAGACQGARSIAPIGGLSTHRHTQAAA